MEIQPATITGAPATFVTAMKVRQAFDMGAFPFIELPGGSWQFLIAYLERVLTSI